LVLAAITVVLVLNNGSVLFEPTQASTNPLLIYVYGIDRNITYEGNWKGYVGPEVNNSCDYCPIGAQAGGALRIPLATWWVPTNISFWVFTNVTGPYLVQVPGCGPAPCVFPWVRVWSYATYVPADTLTWMTLFATLKLPDSAPPGPASVSLNATFCPTPTCPPPP
jgi:hypothetical protein